MFGTSVVDCYSKPFPKPPWNILALAPPFHVRSRRSFGNSTSERFSFNRLQRQGKVVCLKPVGRPPALSRKNQNSPGPRDGAWNKAFLAVVYVFWVVCWTRCPSGKGFCDQPKISVISQMVLGLGMEIFFSIKWGKVEGL